MSIKSNIWKLQADRFIANAWIYVAALVPFLQSHGLGATEVFLTETAFSIAIAAAEIPTGYLSDVIGRKKCFIIGTGMVPIALAFYASMDSFWGFVACEAMLGIALAFRSGTDTSFLYDTLLELKREKEHKKLEGLALSLKSVGGATANIFSGILASFSLILPFLANIVTQLFAFALTFTLKEPKRESKQTQNAKMHFKELRRAVKYTAQHPTLRNAALFLAIINGLGMIGYWSNYLFYSKLGVPVAYFGFLAAGTSIMGALGSRFLHRFDAKFGERLALILPFFMGASMLITGLIGTMKALPFILLTAFLWGFALPLLGNIIHKNTRSDIRATVNSVVNMGGRLLFVLLSAGIGILIDTTSVQTGQICLGTIFMLAAALPVWNLARRSEI